MPIWLHLLLSIVAQMAGVLGCAFLAMEYSDQIDAVGINHTFAFFGSFIIGMLVPRLLFKFVVPAKCPECGGRTIFRGGRPITYNCRKCGHTHRTSVNEGGGRHSYRH